MPKSTQFKKVILAIGNVFEFSDRHNSNLAETELVHKRLQKANFAVSAELALFWGDKIKDRIVVLPQLPDSTFLNLLEKRLNINIKCYVPELATGWVCRDLLNDQNTLTNILSMLYNKEVYILSWGATKYYYQLISELQKREVNIVFSDYSTDQSRWVVDYADSKIGSRSILQNISSKDHLFLVPRGFICHNIDEFYSLAYTLSKDQSESIILKSDLGDGGKAVHLLDFGKIPSAADYLMELVANLSGNPLWKDVPLIIEEAIGEGVNLTTPSADGMIHADGQVSFLGAQNMITVSQKCVGFEMGRGVFPNNIESQLRKIVLVVGKYLYDLGYQGWYDIDFLLENNNQSLYASEINPRRTGGTSPLSFVNNTLGYGWDKTYYLKTYERLKINKAISFPELQIILSGINKSFHQHNAEIVPLHSRGVSLPQPYLAYFIYAKEKKIALRMESILNAKLNK